MFPQPYVPTVLCSHSPMFPQSYVPTALCSHISLAPLDPASLEPQHLVGIELVSPNPNPNPNPNPVRYAFHQILW